MLQPNHDDVRCRLITDDMIEPVIGCLVRGFPLRPASYWVGALERMSRRTAIGDYPRYGYALEANGKTVGVILLIFSSRESDAGSYVRCNISSWCVDAEYRACAILLHMAAVKHKEVTYLNISPATHTRPTIEALGFQRFSNGQIFSAPILSGSPGDVRVRAFGLDGSGSGLPGNERKILSELAALGCWALICVKDGAAYPFVFQRRVVLRVIPCSHLIYCRGLADFARFAGPIGQYLLFRAGPFCIVDANGSTPGLVGRYFAGRNPKYFKGRFPPIVGDLSDTELAIFGA
jgi:hypothetical protein